MLDTQLPAVLPPHLLLASQQPGLPFPLALPWLLLLLLLRVLLPQPLPLPSLPLPPVLPTCDAICRVRVQPPVTSVVSQRVNPSSNLRSVQECLSSACGVQECLSCRDPVLVTNTVRRLPATSVVPFLQQVTSVPLCRVLLCRVPCAAVPLCCCVAVLVCHCMCQCATLPLCHCMCRCAAVPLDHSIDSKAP